MYNISLNIETKNLIWISPKEPMWMIKNNKKFMPLCQDIIIIMLLLQIIFLNKWTQIQA
jgi:hypothetical protein